MTIQETKIGKEVVRTKGEEMVGCIGTIVSIDYDKNRVKVNWGHNTTSLNINSVELTSKPYRIEPAYNYQNQKSGLYTIVFAKYISL